MGCIKITHFFLSQGCTRSLCRFFFITFIFNFIFSSITVFAAPTVSKAPFVKLLTEQGISIGSVETIKQDNQGYLWFGGLDGLVRYDGYNFVLHRHIPSDPYSISSNVIWSIFEDHLGVLWFATDDGLNRFDRETGRFFHYRHEDNNLNSLYSNFTRSIAEDKQGGLWIACFGGLAYLDPERKNFTNYFSDPKDDTSLSANNLRKVFVDRAGNLWIGHNLDGVNRMEKEAGKFHRYPFGKSDAKSSSNGSVASIFEDRDGFIWLAMDSGGLDRLDPAQGTFEHFTPDADKPDGLVNAIVTDIAEDAKGNLWIGTEGGLQLLDRKTKKFLLFQHNPVEKNSLSTNVIRSLFVDVNHDVWIGNFPSGVNFLDTSNMVFKTYQNDPNNKNSLSKNSVLSIEEDREGNLLLGTDGGGLNYFNRKTETFTVYKHDPKNPKSLSSDAVLSIQQDTDGTFWLGTWKGGANHFDPKTGIFEAHTMQEKSGSPISSDNIWSVLNDRQNNLWFSTIGGGLDKYNRESNTFTSYRTEKGATTTFDVVWRVFQDRKDRLWIGTGIGLGRYLPEEDRFVFLKNDINNPDSLSFNVVLDIAEDKNKNLWVATRGGGLNRFDEKSNKFIHYNEKNGLINDVVDSVKVDDSGILWLGTAKGLTRFDPEKNQFINYNENNGIQGNQFNIGSSLKLRSGEMVVGGTSGFTIFNPAELTFNTYVPPVKIVDFQIFNKSVAPGEEGSPLSKLISFTNDIVLDYQQSVFTFSFVALSYRNAEKNKFAYKLEGFEKEWNYVDVDRRNATYTNLNPGTYIFKVKAANNQGVWNNEGTQITVHILPPPWKTWWAYTIYAVLITAVLFGFVYAQNKKIVSERKINKRLQQLDKLKDEFLANTSHELRTPLNGIIGLAESLIDGVAGVQSKVACDNLSMIVSSGRRLERLVNAILDYSKLKEKSLTVYPKALDMHAMTTVVLALSQPAVAGKNVQLINKVPTDIARVFADEDRVQQILHNLIGNAIKFTESGSVTVTAAHINNVVEVCVTDTGIGIPAAELEKIFDSFHQVEGSSIRHYGGTGLGLAITKQLIELQGGSITVKSELGQGAAFYFTLPSISQSNDTEKSLAENEIAIKPAAVNNNEKLSTLTRTREEPSYLSSHSSAMKQDIENENSQFHILIVDDEAVNRQVLLNHLSLQHYHVISAASGSEVFEILSLQTVDLILLDVMMPSMSGYEVCKQLRSLYSSHELPIIFLTAKTQVNDLVTGFALGANDFLTKPINRDELLARVATHLELVAVTRNLEMKVRERTAELQSKHEELEKAYLQLEAISLSDPLTGLSNRRYLQKLIPMDVAKVQREYEAKLRNKPNKEPTLDMAFFLLDVDFFKPVNDEYGHITGDLLLIQLSDLLTKLCRESDCVVRWGGEEFLIVSRFSNRDEAPLMAERIRNSIANHDFTLSDDLVLHKTCSIGYACFPFIADNPMSLTWEQVIDTADHALYAAKKSGRNRCVGLAASDITQQEFLYKRIGESVQALIEKGELTVLASDKGSLIWE